MKLPKHILMEMHVHFSVDGIDPEAGPQTDEDYERLDEVEARFTGTFEGLDESDGIHIHQACITSLSGVAGDDEDDTTDLIFQALEALKDILIDRKAAHEARDIKTIPPEWSE